ncbi:MAG TPA: hypothetical protein VHT03_05705 [Rhizomicrobium sp.]|nr:hypothetical protein [Rhizomicrobium sp.]
MKVTPLHLVKVPRETVVEDELLCALNLFKHGVEPVAMYDLLADRLDLTVQRRSAPLAGTEEKRLAFAKPDANW